MSTRDDDLDAAEKDLAGDTNGKPFIHRPETMELRDGLLCWLDGNRVCGADCVSWNAEIEEDAGPNRCLVLLYMGQQASSAVSAMLVSRRAAVAAQDAIRVAAGGGVPQPPRAKP